MTKKINVSLIAKVGILGAAAFLLTFLSTPLPIFPSFLRLDMSSFATLVAALALGPLAGVLTELVKNLLDFFFGSNSAGIGQLANFVIGSAFVLPLGLIHSRSKNVKGFLIGAAAGIISMTLVGMAFNYFVFIPVYAKVLGVEQSAFVGMAQKVNPNITDLKTLIILAIAPFNLIKGTLVSILGFVFYKSLKPLIKS